VPDGRLRVSITASSIPHTGIGRYVSHLTASLAGSVEYVPVRLTAGVLSAVPLLRQLPLTLAGVDATAPLHVSQIVGAGVLIFRRLPPTVVTVHDLGPLVWAPEGTATPAAARLLLRLHFSALQRADRVIAVSHSTARSLVDRLRVDPARITVVYEGVDHDVFWPRSEARARLDERLGVSGWEDCRTLLVVGTELPRKNLEAVLEALRFFRTRGQRVRLLKVGSTGGAGWRERTTRLAAEFGVLDAVRFLEGVTDEELALLYRAADAYVCVSHVEGFSLPTLEALACGAAAVVAPNGALPELVGDGGIVLSGSGAAALVEALERLFAQPEMAQELRGRAVERAEAFSWQRMGNETLSVYRALASAITRS
jgi:glycosyltransferase involved in cell wall biosynthesis